MEKDYDVLISTMEDYDVTNVGALLEWLEHETDETTRFIIQSRIDELVEV